MTFVSLFRELDDDDDGLEEEQEREEGLVLGTRIITVAGGIRGLVCCFVLNVCCWIKYTTTAAIIINVEVVLLKVF